MQAEAGWNAAEPNGRAEPCSNAPLAVRTRRNWSSPSVPTTVDPAAVASWQPPILAWALFGAGSWLLVGMGAYILLA